MFHAVPFQVLYVIFLFISTFYYYLHVCLCFSVKLFLLFLIVKFNKCFTQINNEIIFLICEEDEGILFIIDVHTKWNFLTVL